MSLVGALRLDELQEILDDVRFHDNWKITLQPHDFEGICIRLVGVNLLDSYDHAKGADLGINDFLPPIASKEQFLEWLEWRFERIASHEVREHLLYKGERIFDPHVTL